MLFISAQAGVPTLERNISPPTAILLEQAMKDKLSLTRRKVMVLGREKIGSASETNFLRIFRKVLARNSCERLATELRFAIKSFTTPFLVSRKAVM